MFKVRSEPLLLSEAGLYGLCVSLNTPVLNIEELPVGPARAAVVLYDGGYGSLGLAVAVRSIETRQVAVFAYQGVLDMQTETTRAMEDATSFSERMGFLFDDDIVAGSTNGRTRALKLWGELTDAGDLADEVEELDELAPPALSPAVRLEPQPEELVLDHEAEIELIELPAADEPAPDDELWLDELTEDAPFPPPARQDPAPVAQLEDLDASADGSLPPAPEPGAVSLSKFRHARGAGQRDPAGESANGRSSELGRIALVRRRGDSQQGEPVRPGLLLRLLSSF